MISSSIEYYNWITSIFSSACLSNIDIIVIINRTFNDRFVCKQEAALATKHLNAFARVNIFTIMNNYISVKLIMITTNLHAVIMGDR